MVTRVHHYGLDQVPVVPGRAHAGHRLHQHAFRKVSLGQAGRDLLGRWVRTPGALSPARPLLSNPSSSPHYRELSHAGVDEGGERPEENGHLNATLIRGHFYLLASVSSSLNRRVRSISPGGALGAAVRD